MTIAITGFGGQLGTALTQHLGSKATPLTRAELDLSNPSQIQRVLIELSPSALINAAAYTAVDKAEEDIDRCMLVNGQSVSILSEVCEALDIPLVQISTDYVFGASDIPHIPRQEGDKVLPQGVYAKSKLLGERNATEWKKHFIIRTCGLYSMAEEGPIRGRNFVDTMLHLGLARDALSIVDDQFCTPTSITDLCEAIEFLLQTDAYGTYHVTNQGGTNWLNFAARIFEKAQISVDLTGISTEQYKAPAPRPSYSVMDTSKYHALGGPVMPAWEYAVDKYINIATQLLTAQNAT